MVLEFQKSLQHQQTSIFDRDNLEDTRVTAYCIIWN